MRVWGPLLTGMLLVTLQSVYETLLDHVQKLLEKRTKDSSKPSYTTMPALMATIQVTYRHLSSVPQYQQQAMRCPTPLTMHRAYLA